MQCNQKRNTMDTILIQIDGKIFAEDERGMINLYPYEHPQVGDEVFWIDPCYWDNDEHTSRWAEITDIQGEIIVLDYNTEVLVGELYW